MSVVAPRRLPAGLLGAASAPVTHVIDARWLMAYAAGLGETAASFYDTIRPEGPAAHPMFSVCYDWPALVDLRERVIGEALAPFSVHATHDLRIVRPPRAGDVIATTARVVAVEPRRAGSLVVTRLHSVDATGAPVTITDYGSVYRGVEPVETGRIAEPHSRADVPAGDAQWNERIAVPATAAHVYTECARIWNPIHTDARVARDAGLPAIILHGTATLALAVSCVVRRELAGDARAVHGISARFTGFVPLPSTLIVRGRGRAGTSFAFDVTDPDGTAVLSEGAMTA
jgi:acyl dehydratase